MHWGWFEISWLGGAFTATAAVVVAVLARLSPKRDWEFIKDGPAYVLLGLSVLTALVLPLFVPAPDYGTCAFDQYLDHIQTGAVETPCPVTAQLPAVIPWVNSFIRIFIVSPVQDIPFELGGVGLGFLIGTGLRRLRPAP
jgi:hypothetical protein